VKLKVLTPGKAHVCHKFLQDLLCWAPEQFQNLLAMTLNIHVNNLNLVFSTKGTVARWIQDKLKSVRALDMRRQIISMDIGQIKHQLMNIPSIGANAIKGMLTSIHLMKILAFNLQGIGHIMWSTVAPVAV
jgi:hypothetical protein